jgi:hypothetical protein
MAAILEEQRRRQQQVKADVERRSHQREYLLRLRSRIEERLKGGVASSAEPLPSASNGAGGGKSR